MYTNHPIQLINKLYVKTHVTPVFMRNKQTSVLNVIVDTPIVQWTVRSQNIASNVTVL